MTEDFARRLPLTIATRGSPLALAQAEEVAGRLRAAHAALAAPEAIRITPIKTTGDRIQDRPLQDAGGKGLFTKEIEAALLLGAADIAVHSMKDVPTLSPAGLVIDCILPREDPRDAFISARYPSFEALPEGAHLATGSIRRQAFSLCRRPDLTIVPLRGNVATRLKKLKEGVAAATYLAVAGLNRLGQAGVITDAMPPETMLPAVAQGAIGVQCRAGDALVSGLLGAIDCRESRVRVAAERALLAVLDGSCRTPIAAYAMLEPDGVWLRGAVAAPDGSFLVEGDLRGALSEAERLGRALGEQLKAKLPPGIVLG